MEWLMMTTFKLYRPIIGCKITKWDISFHVWCIAPTRRLVQSVQHPPNQSREIQCNSTEDECGVAKKARRQHLYDKAHTKYATTLVRWVWSRPKMMWFQPNSACTIKQGCIHGAFGEAECNCKIINLLKNLADPRVGSKVADAEVGKEDNAEDKFEDFND